MMEGGVQPWKARGPSLGLKIVLPTSQVLSSQPLQELEREFLLPNERKGNLRWERVRGDYESCGSFC